MPKTMRLTDDELRELHLSGLSANQIAAKFGYGHPTIIRRLRQMGIYEDGKHLDLPDDEIRELYQSGVRPSQIAARYGCTGGTIINRLQKMGVYLAKKGRAKTKLPDDETLRDMLVKHGPAKTAEMIGFQRGSIYSHMRRLYPEYDRRFTKHEYPPDDELRILFEKHPPDEAARILGVNRHSVYHQMRRLGITPIPSTYKKRGRTSKTPQGEDLMRLLKSHTPTEIADMYGVSPSSIYMASRSYRKSQNQK